MSRTTSRSSTGSGNTFWLTNKAELPDVVIRDEKKWVYDAILDKYVPLKKTPYVAAKLEYLHCLCKISLMDSHEVNLELNNSFMQDLTQLELLRYSYFEGFDDGSGNDGTANSLVKKKVADGRSCSAVSAIGLATTSSTVEEGAGTFTDGNSIHNKSSSSNNMRSLLTSDQFWNTCYHDLKFESMVESNDIYDKLPSMQTTKLFYVEFIDYILLNLHIIKPRLNQIRKSTEYKQLSKQYHLYFNNHHYNHLYQSQLDFEGKEVNDKLIETIITNFDAVKRMYRLDPHLVSVWKQFFQLLTNLMTQLRKSPSSSMMPPAPLPPQGLEFTQQPNPSFARKTQQQQQQQSPQLLVDSQSSSIMSKREGSVSTMDTVVTLMDEMVINNKKGGGENTQLLPLSEINSHTSEMKVVLSNGSDSIMNRPKKKKSFFSKLRGK